MGNPEPRRAERHAALGDVLHHRERGVGGPFPWLVATFGDPGFLLPYLALSVCFSALLFGIYRLAARGRRSNP